MDVGRHAAKQPDKSSSRLKMRKGSRASQQSAGEAGTIICVATCLQEQLAMLLAHDDWRTLNGMRLVIS